MMQQSRARFKYAIRAVKQRENALRRESLAKKMANNSMCFLERNQENEQCKYSIT